MSQSIAVASGSGNKLSGFSQFDNLLEKATSYNLMEPDLESVNNICDLLCQQRCQAKYAMEAIKRKITVNDHPLSVIYALQVLESVVKTCGTQYHDEVATKEFMKELHGLTKPSCHKEVREKVLDLIASWAHAFSKIKRYEAVQEVFDSLKAEGVEFKPQNEDEMIVEDVEMTNDENCYKCDVKLGQDTQKHQCKKCNRFFCKNCSTKLCTHPKFAIQQEMRVCHTCFENHEKGLPNTANGTSFVTLGDMKFSTDCKFGEIFNVFLQEKRKSMVRRYVEAEDRTYKGLMTLANSEKKPQNADNLNNNNNNNNNLNPPEQ